MPGSLTSSTRQLGASGRWLRRNSGAEPNPSTRSPTDSTSRLMARRIDGSSSTTKTTDATSVIKQPLLWGRQGKLKERSLGAGLCRQTASMRLYDRSGNRQSHSDALRFGGKEWFEDMLRLLRI